MFALTVEWLTDAVCIARDVATGLENLSWPTCVTHAEAVLTVSLRCGKAL